MNVWLTIIGIGAGTYILRASMFVLLGRRSLPAWTEAPMALIGPAAIAALVTSMLLTRHGSLVAPPLAELTAIVCGIAAVRRSGNVMHAFAAGMPAFWIVSLLG
jgi:branched-subunit amino acid transport protein